MRMHLNLATALTFCGMGSGVSAALLMQHGHVAWAWSCFIVAGLADLFDGVLARRTPMTLEQSQLGLQLDSLADMVNFGVVPVFLLYGVGLNSLWDAPVLAFYIFAATQRLAYFNVYGTHSEGAATYYKGLPVTYSALILPLVFVIGSRVGADYSTYSLRVAVLGLAFSYISARAIPKPGGVFYGIFPVLACATILALFW